MGPSTEQAGASSHTKWPAPIDHRSSRTGSCARGDNGLPGGQWHQIGGQRQKGALLGQVSHIGVNAYKLSGQGLVSTTVGCCEPPLSA